MFSSFLKFAVVIAGIGLFIGYLVHDPLPPDVPERSLAQFGCDIIAFIELLSSVTEFFGFSNRWWPYQLPLPNPKISTDGVIIYEKQLAEVDCIFVQPELKNSVSPTPAIIWIVGGGFVSGNAGDNIPTFVLAAKETEYLVVAPNYRKAPQYPFPTPFNDCLKSTLEFIKRAKEFNVDSSKIAVGGVSAGGNLAMAITLEIAKQKKTMSNSPAILVLVEAFIQMVNFRLPSHQLHQRCVYNVLPKFFLSYAGLYQHQYWTDLPEIVARNRHIRPDVAEKLSYISYEALPKKYQVKGLNSSALPLPKRQTAFVNDQPDLMEQMEKFVLDPRSSPLSASDKELNVLPKTHIALNEYDPFRDEAIILHERLKNLNKDVSLQILSKSVHGSSGLGVIYEQDNYYKKQIKIVFRTIKEYFDQ